MKTNAGCNLNKELADALPDDIAQTKAEINYFNNLYTKELFHVERDASFTLCIINNLKERLSNEESELNRLKAVSSGS